MEIRGVCVCGERVREILRNVDLISLEITLPRCWVNEGKKRKGRGPDVGTRLFRLTTLLVGCF